MCNNLICVNTKVTEGKIKDKIAKQSFVNTIIQFALKLPFVSPKLLVYGITVSPFNRLVCDDVA